MARKINLAPREYMGRTIYRSEPGSHKLPWYTIGPSMAADTLAGIKELIREEQDTQKTFNRHNGRSV